MLRRDSALPQGERNAMESPMQAWPSPPLYANSPTAIFVGMGKRLQPATTFQGNIGTHQTNQSVAYIAILPSVLCPFPVLRMLTSCYAEGTHGTRGTPVAEVETEERFWLRKPPAQQPLRFS